ncbi:MmgE/PrpD family protein [Teichococcus oryzae]|uniref:MmgE/PrpD family protein n=1 Tax=Teichococcus oryzae TaxID=1608942 RepID=A0A5B2TAT1_9PROT|nr:MmgE/PrpD family protein [Pseudoroseomonas oryzae]KAA2211637.1 MmgE/PrpD family protein [Pseudoroseomonas oryzae]
MEQGLTRRYAALIAGSEPSAEAVAAARDGLLDFLASAVGGLDDGAYLKVRDTLLPQAGAPKASVIGQAQRVDAQTAALLNGTLGHALDYDDVQAGVRGHPSTVILPALLTAAEESGATAASFLGAYVVGVEAMAKLGRAMGSRHYETGFHNTATLGPVGAAAALGHLLRFEPDMLANALGIAATQAAGLRMQFATEVKPLHAGLAARAGVLAVQLARGGLQGNAAFLDGRLGFPAVLGLGGAAPERAVDGWGEPWEILNPGLAFKAYPCCGASHLPADAILDLIAEEGLRAEDIAEAVVTFPPGGDAALVVTEPRNGLDGRFSVEYVIAVALLDGRLGLAPFADRPLRDDVAALLPRIRRQIDHDAPSIGDAPAKRFARVDIRTGEGQWHSRTATRVRGAQDLRAKFLDAAASSGIAEVIPDLVAGMQDAKDLARLLSLLRRSPD